MSTLTRSDNAFPVPPLPLVLRWDAANPLPVRPVPPPKRPRPGLGLEAPPWFPTGPLDQPFDFCGHVERLSADIVARCDALRHIHMPNLLFAVTPARNGHRHGLQARTTPLRFAGGQLITQRRGVAYQVQRLIVDNREVLYLVAFCLPRFLDQDFDDKLITIFHELYHISPKFDGDLRRHGGRCSIHTHSKAGYDAHMADLARQYMMQKPDPSLHGFLRLNFAQLQHRHGSVKGIVVPRPKLVPIGYARQQNRRKQSG